MEKPANLFFAILGVLLYTAPLLYASPQKVDLVPLKRIAAHGQRTVSLSGTEVSLHSSSVPVSSCAVKALAGNTGKLYLGANPVTTSTGYELSPGDAIVLDIDNTSDVYIDAATGGDGWSYVCIH
jgi:hypothetical protein